MDQYIGKLLDNRYEILERIGTGGMAVVYKARCHRLNRLVAVKILKPELAHDAEFRRRFHDESQAVAMLSHPNIMAVYDVSHSDELDYIVMELLDGITLKQYMQKKGLPLNWREALHFITQIMKALSHAHSRGIIHRDIKPQNIMVLRDGSVKVADFGIARVASAAQSTLTQEALGSVHYISPEQARGSHIDNRSDIYSAGVVLYEMTSGRLPFEGDTPVAVAIQHISSIPLPSRDINPDIPEALEGITLKAMASDVDKRYVSADAMLADLEEFRKNPSINFEYTQEELSQTAVVDEPTIVRSAEDTGNVRRRQTTAAPQILRREKPAAPRREKAAATSRRKDYDYDYDDRDYDDRRGGILPVILAIVAILIFIAGIIYFLWTTIFGGILADHSEEVIVPNLVGMTIEEVNRDISMGNISSSFMIVEGGTVTSELPAGQIIHQDPGPNEKKKGEEIIITVDVSSGPKLIIMPNVVNEEYRTALAILQDNMGMKVNQQYENNDEVTRNYVIRSEPMEGTHLEPGQEVLIVISLGPEPKEVMVPNFVDQHIDEVMKQAETLNLEINVTEITDLMHPKGTVVYQSIPAESTAEEGSVITVHISSGPTNEEDPTGQPTDTPNLPPQTGEDLPANTKGKTVSVDLSGYTSPVKVRIEVDGVTQYNSPVDPAVGTFVQTITGTGRMWVSVFVDDFVVQDFAVVFD